MGPEIPSTQRFDLMVDDWTEQILARRGGDESVVGDETMETYGVSLGLGETEIAEAYNLALEKVEEERRNNGF